MTDIKQLEAAWVQMDALAAENELLRGHKDALIERVGKAEAEARGWADSFKQAEAALDSFLGPDGGKTVIELRAALAERDEEMATIQWLAREAIAATWPVRPSDETIESEYQELLADARLGRKP